MCSKGEHAPRLLGGREPPGRHHTSTRSLNLELQVAPACAVANFQPLGPRRVSSLFTFVFAVITRRQLWSAATPVSFSATELPEQGVNTSSGAEGESADTGPEELVVHSGLAQPLILTADENRLAATSPAPGP